jgi:hypothetical protein
MRAGYSFERLYYSLSGVAERLKGWRLRFEEMVYLLTLICRVYCLPLNKSRTAIIQILHQHFDCFQLLVTIFSKSSESFKFMSMKMWIFSVSKPFNNENLISNIPRVVFSKVQDRLTMASNQPWNNSKYQTKQIQNKWFNCNLKKPKNAEILNKWAQKMRNFLNSDCS